jgi:hypothetical protein
VVVVALVFGVLTLRLVRLTSQYAVNIFFWDQWDFNDATLFQRHSLWEIFRWQHGPHRQGLGGLLAALVEPWFRWNSRSEAFVATALVVVAALLALYLKHRLFGVISWTDALIPVAMLSPARWESIWTTVNFSLVLFPVLMMLYCLLWLWKNERLKYGLIVLLNFGCVFTGFAFFTGLLTPVLLIAAYRGGRSGGTDPEKTTGGKIYWWCCMAAAMAALVVFFAGWQANSASGCPSIFAVGLTQYFWFVDLMYATGFGLTDIGLSARAAGAVVLALVVMAALISWRRLLGPTGAAGPRDRVLAILSSHVILFTVSTALGRTCLGLDMAHASRYTLYMQMSIVSLYFWTLTWRPRWGTAGMAGTAGVAPPAILLILLLPSLIVRQPDEETILSFSATKAAWRSCYLSGKEIAVCDEECGPVYPAAEATHLREKLDYLQRTRQNLFSEERAVR